MKQTKFVPRLFAVLMAILMLCSVAPAATLTVASAAKATTSSAAAKKMSKVKVSYTKKLSYTGKARKPKVTVTYGKTTLKKNKDYTVSYKNNTDCGVGTITIKAKKGSAYTGSKTVKFKIIPAKVKDLKAAKTTTSAVKLTWSAVKGAKGYVVYFYNAKTGKYEKIKATKKLALAARGLEAGTLYRFAVRAYIKTDKNYYGPYSAVIKAKTQAAAPQEPTTAVAPTEPTTPTNPTNPTNPTEQTNPTNPTEPETPTVTVAKATGLKATVNDTDVAFSWNIVSGATGYELAQYDDALGDYVLKSAVVGSDARLTKLEAGKTYQFAVRAYVMDGAGKKTYGAYSEPIKVTLADTKPVDPVTLGKVTGLSAKKTDAAVTLSWTAVTGASGYEIATEDGTSYKKVTEVTAANAKLDNLERHKELQLVVRAFAKSGSQYSGYGDYSDPVKVIVYNADYYSAAFRSGTFQMTMYANLDGTGEQPVSFAIKNGNLNFSGTMDVFDNGKKTPVECRMLKNGKLFMKLGSGITATWLDASELFQEGGEFSDMGDLMNMTEMFNSMDFDTSKGVTMSTETKDGVTYEVETIQSNGATTKLYTVNNDLRMITSQNGTYTDEIKIKDFTTNVSDSLFTEPAGAIDLSIFMALAGY